MAVIPSSINHNNDSRQLRQRFIWSGIQIILIEANTRPRIHRWSSKSSHLRGILGTSGETKNHGPLADRRPRQPNSRIKKTRLDSIYLELHMTRLTQNTHGHEHPHLFSVSLRFSQHRNSRAAIWYWRRHHNIRESVFPPPHFSAPPSYLLHCPQQHFYLFSNKSWFVYVLW